MTDTHRPTSPPAPSAPPPSTGHDPHPAPAGYEGSDPDLPAGPDHAGKVSVSTVQVGASAAAAVTSALAASVFGMAGTLIGAALGSIVSTVAGAWYAHYLRRAGRQLRATKSVVIQRIPAEMLASTPLRHLTGPTDLPGEESLRPVGDESSPQAVAVPVAARRDLLDAVDDTLVVPSAGPDAVPRPGSAAPADAVPSSRAWYKRPVLAMSLMGLAGFAIAIGVMTASEGVLGHSWSGDKGQVTFIQPFKAVVDTSKNDQSTPAATTDSPTESATPSPGATAAAATPTASAAATPSAAATITQAPVAPASTPTSSDVAAATNPTPDSASTP